MTAPNSRQLTPTIAGCENEAVHVPGAVQPHGVLLVLDPSSLEIRCLSENSEGLLGLSPRDLGRKLREVASIRNRAELADSLSRPDLANRNLLALELDTGATFDAIAHRQGDQLILELEPSNHDSVFEPAYFHSRVLGSLAQLRVASSLRELLTQTAREMRSLTGFDRVLIYQFMPDWSGEVVAEACANGGTAYWGLRFPASDIPKQARALYTACRLRMVPSAVYTPARLRGLEDERPVDLTHAVLRSISPVHREYMANMGVTASLGVSLMRGEELWGLITCNHESGERFMPYHARVACALLGEVVSSLITTKESVQASDERVTFQGIQAQLLQSVAQERDVGRGLTTHAVSLRDVVHASGAALCHQGELHCVGRTPTLAAIEELLLWAGSEKHQGLVMESLPEHYPPAHAWKDVACGLIAVPIRYPEGSVIEEQSWLLWFRPEVAQTVSWGGDPNKSATNSVDGTQRLNPRTSFKLWKEEVHLKSVPFTDAEIAAARSLAASLVDVVLEIEASRKLRQNSVLLEESNQKLIRQIDETQKVEVELRRAQKLEAIGLLAAGVAHELNTPLQFVLDSVRFMEGATGTLVSLVSSLSAQLPESTGALEEADFEFLAQHVPDSIENALAGVERMGAIVRAMKAFAQPDSAAKSLGDINEALVTTVEIAQGGIRDIADVSLALGSVPAIFCYLGDLNQVFLSLIVNAGQAIRSSRQAAPAGAAQGRGAISIKSWQADSSVFVSITDDGDGIAEAMRETVFLPFFSARPVGSGTGQGLAIAHAIVVQKHGGSLSFESVAGVGTTFTVRLPSETSG